MTERQQLIEFRSFVSLCFHEFDHRGLSTREIAGASGKCASTVRRLRHHDRITLATHFGTVQALGDAAGMRLSMSDKSAKLQVARHHRERVA